MLEALKTIFSASKNPDKVSSKRIAAFLLVLCLVAVVIGNMFFELTIEEYIFAGLTEAVIWSLGFVGAEKFSNMMGKQEQPQQRRYDDYPPRRRRQNNYPPRRIVNESYPDQPPHTENLETEEDMR